MLFTHKLCLTLCDLMVTKPTRLLCPWNSPGKNYWSGLQFLSPEDLPDLGIEPASSALAGRFLTTDPPEKSMKIYSEITDFFFFFGHTMRQDRSSPTRYRTSAPCSRSSET